MLMTILLLTVTKLLAFTHSPSASLYVKRVHATPLSLGRPLCKARARNDFFACRAVDPCESLDAVLIASGYLGRDRSRSENRIKF